jgi:hypothetical protein
VKARTCEVGAQVAGMGLVVVEIWERLGVVVAVVFVQRLSCDGYWTRKRMYESYSTSPSLHYGFTASTHTVGPNKRRNESKDLHKSRTDNTNISLRL